MKNSITEEDYLWSGYSFLYKVAIQLGNEKFQYLGIHTATGYSLVKAFSLSDMGRRYHTLLQSDFYRVGNNQKVKTHFNSLDLEAYKTQNK